MPNPGSVLGQIGESFEQIGADVVKQTVQAPKDIAQAAVESLGLSGGSKHQKQQSKPGQGSQAESQPSSPSKGEPDPEVKRLIARAALEELSGKKPKQKEASVWEKIQQEEQQKKEMEKQRKVAAAKQALPKSSGKRPRGDLYGMKAKKAAAEMSRNVRQD